MRFAVYALLIIFALAGLGLGMQTLTSAANAVHEIEALIMLLAGVVAVSALGVITAIEHLAAKK
jgi:hypothetical protein